MRAILSEQPHSCAFRELTLAASLKGVGVVQVVKPGHAFRELTLAASLKALLPTCRLAGTSPFRELTLAASLKDADPFTAPVTERQLSASSRSRPH